MTEYLSLPVLPAALGYDPRLQFLHEEDAVDAFIRAMDADCRGIFNVAGPGEVPLSVVVRELAKPTLPIPHPIAKPLWRAAWRLGMNSFPVDEFDFIRYVCMVDAGGRGVVVILDAAETVRPYLRE